MSSGDASSSVSGYAITTTFSPPATCTQSLYTMLGPPNYFVYINYPDPVPSSTFGDCYPSVFMSSYLEQKTALTPLPSIAPLICPKGYATVSIPNQPDGYVACCPSGMGLATSASAPFTRPAFNGTCYKDVSTIWVTAYGTESVTASSTWKAPVGAQAYAVPIEGYAFPGTSSNTTTESSTVTASPASTLTTTWATATTTASSGAASTAASTAASAATPSVSAAAQESSSTNNTGAIVGGTVGGVAGLAVILLAIFLLFIRPKRKRAVSGAPELPADGQWQRSEMSTEKEDKPATTGNPHHNPSAVELDGTVGVIAELDSSEHRPGSMYKYRPTDHT